MQNHVNLLYREEEREIALPLCEKPGYRRHPVVTLARGRSARPADEKTVCSETDKFGTYLPQNC